MTLLLVRGGEGFFLLFTAGKRRNFFPPSCFSFFLLPIFISGQQHAFLIINFMIKKHSYVFQVTNMHLWSLTCISGHQHVFMVSNMYFWCPNMYFWSPTCISGPQHAFLVPNMHFWSPTFRWERFKSEIAQKTEL